MLQAQPPRQTRLPAQAEAPSETTPAKPPPGPGELPEETLEEKLLRKNIEISDWLESKAEGIDLYLVGRRLTDKPNQTYVRIESTTFVRQAESVQNSNSLNVNLRLPNVEEYWQVKFSSYDESTERSSTQLGAIRRTPRTQNPGATVGLFQKLGNVRTSFSPRISFGSPIKVSHNLAFESFADFETYKVNPKLQFFASADDGPGMFFSLNFNFTLTDVYSITLINDNEYRDRLHQLTVTNGISLGRKVSETSALSYDFIVDSSNRERYHLDAYTLSLTWSQFLYKSILDYSLSPNVLFPRTRDFQPTPGITFSINLNF